MDAARARQGQWAVRDMSVIRGSREKCISLDIV